MNVRPRRDLAGNVITILGGDHLVIECVIYDPPSWSNRKVYLFLDDHDVTDVIKLTREHAIAVRRQTLEDAIDARKLEES